MGARGNQLGARGNQHYNFTISALQSTGQSKDKSALQFHNLIPLICPGCNGSFPFASHWFDFDIATMDMHGLTICVYSYTGKKAARYLPQVCWTFLWKLSIGAVRWPNLTSLSACTSNAPLWPSCLPLACSAHTLSDLCPAQFITCRPSVNGLLSVTGPWAYLAHS